MCFPPVFHPSLRVGTGGRHRPALDESLRLDVGSMTPFLSDFLPRSEATKQSIFSLPLHGLLVRQESWRCPACERPVRVSRSGRPGASVAWSPATAGAKRT